MGFVDLHAHSDRSDGTYTPSELLDYAVEKKLNAIALTDHDSIDGLDEFLSRAEGKPIEAVPGIEFSTAYQGKDVHLVGLFIDYKSEAMKGALDEFCRSRDNRNRRMCELLCEHGVEITYEEMCETYPDAVLTRAHYGALMISKGYVKSMAEAFDRYIGDHAKCYIPREKVTPVMAVDLVRRCGGVPILAHPPLYHMSEERLDALVHELAENGLVGIEVLYSTYHERERRQMAGLAEKYDLLWSGGSDFHGAHKQGLDLGCGYGSLEVPEEIYQRLKEAADRMKREIAG